MGRGSDNNSFAVRISSLLVSLALIGLHPRFVLSATDPAHVAVLRQVAGAVGRPDEPPFNAWAGDDPCGPDAQSAWPGVRCDAGNPFNAVAEIDLQDARLTGDLPAALFGITSLRSLNLALNPKLTGSIPNTLGNLARLTLLDVHGCSLTGSIPSTVGRLTGLRFFLANQNQLSGSIPAQLGWLPQLYMLDVIDNRLHGTVPPFPGASELVHLHMSRNLLTAVPAYISQLPKLEHLLVDSNRLTHNIPLAFNNTNLTVIYWSHNVLPSLPSPWFLPKLKDFLASNCSLPSQPLPSFPLSANLSNLDLSSNKFSDAIPATLFHQNPHLINLNLANNSLSAGLPQAITTASKLQSLFLADNQLVGPLPDMSVLPAIIALSLYDNDFSLVPPALLLRPNVTLQLYGNDLCKPFRAEIQQQCSPPAPLTQYTAPAFCPSLACTGDLFRPSAPLFLASQSCVCVSPLRAELGLYLSDLVVFNGALVRQLEDRLFAELSGSKASINLTRAQVQVTAISSRSSLTSLASTFASDHTTHESTLVITALFFPPADDGSWQPSDTPRAIRGALSTRDQRVRTSLEEFGSYRVEGFYGPAPYTPPEKASSGVSTGAIVAIAVCSSAVAVALIVALLMRPWEKRGWSVADYEALEGINIQHARRYSLKQLEDATNGFDDQLVLGEGGYGKVYHGVLGGEPVAVKKATERRRHGGVDFKNEIEMLTAVAHGNLVKLTGFCVEKDEQLLVFEFMEGGALDAWIKGKMDRMLTWRERMRIALHAASALHYLHREMKPAIIHRDIKPANILLTAGLEAKVADFGISKSLPERGEVVQEEIMGSRGYIDPHFQHSEVLTERSDVYSFGVVLLQLATGQPALIHGVPLSQVALHLAFGAGGLTSVIDPRLRDVLVATTAGAATAGAGGGGVYLAGPADGSVSAGEMVEGLEDTFGTFLRVALWCTAEHPSLRPDMEQVVCALRSIRDQLTAGPSDAAAGSIHASSSGFATPSSGHGGLPPFDASSLSSPSSTQQHSMSGAHAVAYSQQAAQPHCPALEADTLGPLWGPAPAMGVHPPSSSGQGAAEREGGYDGGLYRAADTATDGQGQTQTMTGPRAR
ncbi:hypothetical protein CLOM_g19479 [Closterium sp. NIES-68]|nr:hypothetical protein CLOM_g19479 [Closterium sp. NIES-68]GJP81973.1 hypothetical protein CLOP_g12098 [Closterium sp. NIES-67]